MHPQTLAQLEPELEDSFSIIHQQDPELNAVPCRLRYNRILLIGRGKGGLTIDGNIFELSAGSMVLVSQGQIIAYNAGSSFQGYQMSFGDCFWEKAPSSAANCKAMLFNNASANQQLFLPVKDLEELLLLFNFLHVEYSGPAYINRADAMAAYLKIIMIKTANINALLAGGFDSQDKKLYRSFRELISQHYRSSHEVADYAAMLSITSRKLTGLCKTCSGKGAKELINGQLMAEAKRSLMFSSMAVKEIAFSLNFSSAEQFSHFFKKNSGYSPQDYRNLLLSG